MEDGEGGTKQVSCVRGETSRGLRSCIIIRALMGAAQMRQLVIRAEIRVELINEEEREEAGGG